VRQLASEATTQAIREQLSDVAAQAGGLNMATHKFAVGQIVRFSPDRADRDQINQGQRQFKIVRLLPETASVFQYRVKSQLDGHERVVREDQLARV
jgi:hypothetical protein